MVIIRQRSLCYYSLRINPKQMALHQIVILIVKKNITRTSSKKNINLSAETNLHIRGQPTLGQDYSSTNTKQIECDFSYWEKMSIRQITFWKWKFYQLRPNPWLFNVLPNTTTNICCCLCCHCKVSATTIAKIQLFIWEGAKKFI